MVVIDGLKKVVEIHNGIISYRKIAIKGRITKLTSICTTSKTEESGDIKVIAS